MIPTPPPGVAKAFLLAVRDEQRGDKGAIARYLRWVREVEEPARAADMAHRMEIMEKALAEDAYDDLLLGPDGAHR